MTDPEVEAVLDEFTASRYVPDFRQPHTQEAAHHRCRDMATEIVRLRHLVEKMMVREN